MSHFTVLVIGAGWEAQLARYDENRDMPEYISEAVSDEAKMRFLEYYKRKESVKETKKGQSHTDIKASLSEFPKYYQTYGKAWNGNAWRPDSNGVWQEYSTYNPKSKWDWYQMGGRWTGMLKLKPGRTGQHGSPRLGTESAAPDWVDQALKGAIDWEGMAADARQAAEKRWEDYQGRLKEAPSEELRDNWRGWWEADAYANDRYPSSPQKDYADFDAMVLDLWAVQCAQRAGVISFFEEEVPSREQYLAAQEGFSTYAVVSGGEWYAKGEMAWWGISSETEEEAEQWDGSFFDKWIAPLDDEVLLTVVDCHI